jgi:putative transposase
MMFEFIHAEKANFPITMLCRVLEVSRSGYYQWVEGEVSERRREDAKLRVEIAAIHRESGGTYGSPRVHVEMNERGFEIGRHRVARLMREMGLAGVPSPALADDPFGAAGDPDFERWTPELRG